MKANDTKTKSAASIRGEWWFSCLLLLTVIVPIMVCAQGYLGTLVLTVHYSWQKKSTLQQAQDNGYMSMAISFMATIMGNQGHIPFYLTFMTIVIRLQYAGDR